jgi:hypothetical protein
MAEIEVEPGMDGLLILCKAFTHVVSAGIQDPAAAEEGLHIVIEAKGRSEVDFSTAPRTFEEMVHDGLHLLKSHFDRLVLPRPEIFPGTGRQIEESNEESRISDSLIPSTLQVPTPAVLHAFVRALGAAEDYDGLLNLLQWMSRCAPVLKERADEFANGERMMRRTLAAVRVFLEGSWENDALLREPIDRSDAGVRLNSHSGRNSLSIAQDSKPEFSDPYVEEAYKIIEGTEGWGPWPTDEETRLYLLWRSNADE